MRPSSSINRFSWLYLWDSLVFWLMSAWYSSWNELLCMLLVHTSSANCRLSADRLFWLLSLRHSRLMNLKTRAVTLRSFLLALKRLMSSISCILTVLLLYLSYQCMSNHWNVFHYFFLRFVIVYSWHVRPLLLWGNLVHSITMCYPLIPFRNTNERECQLGFAFLDRTSNFFLLVDFRISLTRCWTYCFQGLLFLIQQSVVYESVQ